jgi:predicted DNA-binding transcriptional regulator AlpA
MAAQQVQNHYHGGSEPQRIIRDDEVQRLTGLKRGIRFQLEVEGKFPRRRKITERLTGYVLSEVSDWVNDTAANAPTIDYPEPMGK